MNKNVLFAIDLAVPKSDEKEAINNLNNYNLQDGGFNWQNEQ
jgi:hypothetical protein